MPAPRSRAATRLAQLVHEPCWSSASTAGRLLTRPLATPKTLLARPTTPLITVITSSDSPRISLASFLTRSLSHSTHQLDASHGWASAGHFARNFADFGTR